MSRFFIERPIFAAVLSIIIVLAGLVATQDPADRAVPGDRAADGDDHGQLPRRVGRDARARPWPRRSRSSCPASRTCSTSSRARPSNGQVQITATFEVGIDIDKATFNVNNRVQLAHAAAARRGAPQRRHGRQALDQLPAGHRAQLAQQHARHAVPVELRDVERRRRDQAHRRRGRRHHLRRTRLFDAAVARSRTAWRSSA